MADAALCILGGIFVALVVASETVKLRRDLRELDSMIDKLDAPRSERESR